MGLSEDNAKIANAAELISTVRGGDYDRFLAIQCAPRAARAGLYALTAFHIEVARIAQTVSEPMIGHIRLAWWREALAEMTAGKAPRNHPVMLALAPLLVAQPTLHALLLSMVDARAADLDDSLLAEENAWLAYCDATAGALARAWALLLDANAAATQDALIAEQARAYAVVGLVRSIPFMAQQGVVRFPQDRLLAHGVTSLAPLPALAAMVERLVQEALSNAAKGQLTKSLKPLIGLNRLMVYDAKRVQAVGCNPYQLRPAKFAKVWRMVKLNYI